MADGAFKLMKTVFNLVLVAAVIVGAYIGYLKFFAGDEKTAKKKQAVLAHVDAKEWQEAIDKMEEFEEDEKLKAFVKEQSFVCYRAMAHEENDKAMDDEREASTLKKSNKEESDRYRKKAAKHYKKVLKSLDEAEKRGQLTRVDVMMRGPAHKFLGNDSEARAWMKKQKDYPKE